MGFIKQERGFAVLTSALLLSIAGVAFTANMAATQLIDNQVMGNYYRNNEAFVHAESGIHMILSKIDESSAMLANLPLTYQPAGSHYTVQIKRLNKNTVQISSLGYSMDGTAQREVQLQVHYETAYNIPPAPIASNGKLNLDATATINDGCEGLNAADCKSPGNIAKYPLVSQPGNETQVTECTGTTLGENQIASTVLVTPGSADNFLLIGEQKSVIDEFGDSVSETTRWPYAQPAGSTFYGIAAAESLSPATLFESTFGVNREVASNILQGSAEVATIDMNINGAMGCSKQLKGVGEETATIYIKGDCDIDQHDAAQSLSSENKYFTIGSVDHPKLVFIEGGTFISAPNTGAAVIGMLYFLPGKHSVVDKDGDTQLVEDSCIDMGGIRVNGALLSEYSCSFDGDDKSDNKGTKQHFSVRYDKTVLNKLYEDTGNIAIDSGYRIVAGSWRDF